MDWLNDARAVLTVVGFVCFVAICFWAWSKPARSRFDEAAMIPLREDDRPSTGNQQH